MLKEGSTRDVIKIVFLVEILSRFSSAHVVSRATTCQGLEAGEVEVLVETAP